MSSEPSVKPVLTNNVHLMFEDVQELVMCKPRIIPLKSFTLEKLDKMQKEAERIKVEVKKHSAEEN